MTLPAGWTHATLGDIGDYHNGRGFKKGEWSDDGRPIIRIQNLTSSDKPFNYFEGEVEPRHEVHPGDLLLSWAATLDVFRWAGPEAVLNQHIFKVESFIDPDFHFWMLKGVLEDLRQRSHGTGIVHITRSKFVETKILLPPLEEQRVIAGVLKRQFDALHQAKQRLGRAMQLLDDHGAAVLHTTLPAGPLVTLGEIADVGSGLTKGRKVKEPTREWPFLRAANVRAGSIDLGEVKEIPATEREAERFRLLVGDVLMVEGSGSPQRLGQGWVWEGQIPNCLHQNHVFRARPDTSRLLPRYLAWVLQSPNARAYFFRETKTTSGLATINKRQVSALPVPLPGLEEQARIVAELDTATAGAQALREAVAGQSAAIENLTRSVLHRALCGCFTERQAGGIPAAELLARIAENRAGAGKRRPNKSRAVLVES